jgi:hypothetical protein
VSYRIVVTAAAATGAQTVRDSGVVASGQSYLIAYGGEPLRSDTNYSWTGHRLHRRRRRRQLIVPHGATD